MYDAKKLIHETTIAVLSAVADLDGHTLEEWLQSVSIDQDAILSKCKSQKKEYNFERGSNPLSDW